MGIATSAEKSSNFSGWKSNQYGFEMYAFVLFGKYTVLVEG